MTITMLAVHNAFKMFEFEMLIKAKAKARAKGKTVQMLQTLTALALILRTPAAVSVLSHRVGNVGLNQLGFHAINMNVDHVEMHEAVLQKLNIGMQMAQSHGVNAGLTTLHHVKAVGKAAPDAGRQATLYGHCQLFEVTEEA